MSIKQQNMDFRYDNTIIVCFQQYNLYDTSKLTIFDNEFFFSQAGPD